MIEQELKNAHESLITAIDNTHPDWVLRRIVIEKRKKEKKPFISRYVKYLTRNKYLALIFGAAAASGYFFSSQIIIPIIIILGWLLTPIDETVNGEKCETEPAEGENGDEGGDDDPEREHGPICIPDDTEASGWRCYP